MKSVVILVVGIIFSLPAFAQEAGFYTKGISAATADGAQVLLMELSGKTEDYDICYAGDYESALENTHDSISIAVNDVYGESEHPPLDTDVSGSDGKSFSAIIFPCN